MTEEKEAGLDLQKFVLDGLSGGVKTVAVKGGKWVLGRALLAAGVDPDLLKSTDQKILDEISVLQDLVGDVQHQLDDLSSQMRDLGNQLTQQFKGETLNGHAGTIEGQLVKLCDLFNDGGCNCQGLNIFKSGYQTGNTEALADWTPPSPKTLSLRAAEIEATVANAMDKIKDGLVGTDTSRGFLDTLGDGIILKLQGGNGDLLSWYLYLEKRYLEYVTVLLHGMVLKCNSISYLQDEPEKDAVEAQRWMRGHYRDLISEVVKEFTGVSERLVLSRYQSLVQAAEPSFPSAEVLFQIFSRVDLLEWLLTVQDPEDTDPGVRVRRFLRSSQVQDGGGPMLRSGVDYTPSNGHLVGIPEYYRGGEGSLMSHWYKCVDLLESDGFLTLAAFKGSDIRIVRYRWPWPLDRPAPGRALEETGFFSNVVNWSFDKRTLRKAESSSSSTVNLASYTDARPILENLSFVPSPEVPAAGSSQVFPWEHDAFIDPKTNDDAQDLLTDLEWTASCAQPPYRAALSLTVPPHKKYTKSKGPARYKFKLKRNLFYPGQSREIHVYFSETLKVSMPQRGKRQDYHPLVDVDLRVRALSFKGPAQNNDRDDDRIKTLFDKATQTNKLPIDLTEEVAVGERFDLAEEQFNEVQWRVYVTARKQSKMEYSTEDPTPVKAEHEIAYFRYAWPQPKLKG